MKSNPDRTLILTIILGDLLIYLLVTLVGFLSHDRLSLGSMSRILATFIPFSISWLMLAPWFGLYRKKIICHRKYIFRVLIVAVLAAPVGAFLRGLWLNSPVLPTFVLVMAAVSAAFLIAWRLILPFIVCRTS